MNQVVSPKMQLVGSALMLLGAILYSSKAIIVKLAYRYEIDPLSLLTLRMLFSIPFYVIILVWVSKKTTHPALPKSDWFRISGIGITGYYIASILDFMGLQYIPAGLERLILFMYPTLVVLILAISFRQKIKPITWIALIITYFGIALAFFNTSSSVSRTSLHLGGVLVFLAALSFAFYIVWGAGIVQRVGSLRFTAIGMLAAAAIVVIQHGVMQQWQLGAYPREVYGLCLLMAVIATVIPSFLIMEAIRLIGPSKGAIIGSIGPVSTIVLAYYFLNEAFDSWQLLGTIVVIFGVLIISLSRNSR